MLKLSEHQHSYKLRPHSHTSYGPLIVLLAIVGLVLGSFTVAAQSPGPESGSVGLTGIVEGEPPESAATIDSPTNNSRFDESPVTVSGTCPADTLVEVYKNDIFAGSTLCTSQGVYSFEIDLLFGENILLAQVYDALNQAGPPSDEVTIFYDGLPPQPSPINSLDFGGGAQLLLNTNSAFRGTFPDETLAVPVSIIGGTPPYAVNVQWGDSNNAVISRNDNVNFNATHSYARAGTYQVTLQASDSAGRVAFLTVAAIVNGAPDGSAGTTATTSTPNQLLALWPLYVSRVAIVVSFWLGELREKRILQKRGPVYKTPT
jgi:hypothetical protein